MFSKLFKSSKSKSRQADTSTIYAINDFQTYAEVLSAQHHLTFKTVTLTHLMKIVNGIENEDIPEMLYIEDNTFLLQPRNPAPSEPLVSVYDTGTTENLELYEDDDSRLDLSFDAEEPFVLVKQSRSLPTIVMPTKLITDLKEYTRFKKSAKRVNQPEASTETNYEVLEDQDQQNPSSTS